MTPLLAELLDLIRDEGPLPVDRFMALCLSHPRHGYYMTRDPFGQNGDFVTAPEISQMFGELLGLWASAVWQSMGEPAAIRLVELGPGRGTLMADALRALRVVPGFRDAIRVDLVETSPVLRRAQELALRASGVEVTWHRDISTLAGGPLIVLANEFLDALPVRQFQRVQGRWHERLVGEDGEGKLAFGLAGAPTHGLDRAAPEGAVLEIPAAALALTSALAARIARDGGAWLAIDYGSLVSGFGDTLQSVRRHAFLSPLDAPGEADLTVHVDFAAVAGAAEAAGAAVSGPTTQAAFLLALGLAERAGALGAKASLAQRQAIIAACERLAGQAPTAMGTMFKAIGIGHPALGRLPGFAGSGTSPR